MTCPRCQTMNPDGAMTCAACGAPLLMGAPGAAPAGYPPPAGGMYPPPGGPMPYGGQPYMMPPQTKSSGLSIAGFVLSLVGLFTYAIPSVIGLILAIVGLNQVKASNGQRTGGGLAIAGIVISIVGILIWAFIIIAAIAFVKSHPHDFAN